ncbi:MAG: RNA polymerase factor sigma-54 [bacterium]|nr:RNA polymerase factor sigma-54 [bacterium]
MLTQRLLQRQVQKLVMTPQMQQAIQLLQLQTMELAQLIEQEMEQNPMLEQVEAIEPEEEPTVASDEVDTSISVPPLSEPERTEGSDSSEQLTADDLKAVEEINWDDLFSDDRIWESTSSEVEPYSEEKRGGYISNIATRGQTLQEYLLSQLSFAELSKRESLIAETIIGNIDVDGYLNVTIEEIVQEVQKEAAERGIQGLQDITAEEVQKVLDQIQQFDPPGVAARSLQECLLLQLPARKIDDPIVKEILTNHFQELERHKYPQLAKKLKVPLSRIQKAIDIISTLEPKPGRQFIAIVPQTIIPDVIVEKVDGEYQVRLNDDDIPQLRISPVYQSMLRNREKLSKEQYEFLLDKYKSAKNLIRNIERRKKTILLITESIVKMQRDFFEKGIEFLKPLKLREIAEQVGVHESTVARVTTNKYVQTPHGLFELKYFFSSGVDSDGGDMVSARSIRQMIQSLIQNENPQKPLSDQTIADILNAKGINIARRTVAKYREQMKILPAHMRKRIT